MQNNFRLINCLVQYVFQCLNNKAVEQVWFLSCGTLKKWKDDHDKKKVLMKQSKRKTIWCNNSWVRPLTFFSMWICFNFYFNLSISVSAGVSIFFEENKNKYKSKSTEVLLFSLQYFSSNLLLIYASGCGLHCYTQT